MRRKKEPKQKKLKPLWPRVSLLVFLPDNVQHCCFKRFLHSVWGVLFGFILVFLLLPQSFPLCLHCRDGNDPVQRAEL